MNIVLAVVSADSLLIFCAVDRGAPLSHLTAIVVAGLSKYSVSFESPQKNWVYFI